jgi:hypothetical protein
LNYKALSLSACLRAPKAVETSVWPFACTLLVQYGPPPDCKGIVGIEVNSLRKCIRPLVGESILRAHDDDPRVPVLINRSVTEDHVSTQGFRRLTVRSSYSLLSRLEALLIKPPQGRLETGKRVSVFQASACFPRPCYAGAQTAVGLSSFSLNSTAQAIRASLLAIATTTLLRVVRCSS